MDKVRLGVVGAGNIAVMNVRGYVDDPRCDVVAVCDTNEEVGRLAAQEWGGAAYYPALDAMLADSSIDAVEVLTPTHLHHDHVIAGSRPPSRTLSAGRDVENDGVMRSHAIVPEIDSASIPSLRAKRDRRNAF